MSSLELVPRRFIGLPRDLQAISALEIPYRLLGAGVHIIPIQATGKAQIPQPGLDPGKRVCWIEVSDIQDKFFFFLALAHDQLATARPGRNSWRASAPFAVVTFRTSGVKSLRPGRSPVPVQAEGDH